MAASPGRGLGIAAVLKEHRGEMSWIVAYGEDDEATKIAAPDVRQRVQRMMRTLSEIKWSRVELFNRKGEVVHIHKRCPDDETPATELEDLAAGAHVTGQSAQVSGLLAVSVHWVLRAQETALLRQQSGMQVVLDAQTRLIDATMRRFDLMDQQNAELTRANHQLSAALVQTQLETLRRMKAEREATDENGSESGKVLEGMLPDILKAALSKTDEKPNGGKPNGEKKKQPPQPEG